MHAYETASVVQSRHARVRQDRRGAPGNRRSGTCPLLRKQDGHGNERHHIRQWRKHSLGRLKGTACPGNRHRDDVADHRWTSRAHDQTEVPHEMRAITHIADESIFRAEKYSVLRRTSPIAETADRAGRTETPPLRQILRPPQSTLPWTRYRADLARPDDLLAIVRNAAKSMSRSAPPGRRFENAIPGSRAKER